MSTNDDLGRAFGNYLEPEKAADWELVKARLHARSPVSGKVVARYIFGIFLDIGVGFPSSSLNHPVQSPTETSSGGP